MVELKAWSHLVWEKLQGSERNRGMLEGSEEQVRRYLANNEGNLVIEFAWKIPDEIGDLLEELGGEFGSRLSWFEETLRNGGFRPNLP